MAFHIVEDQGYKQAEDSLVWLPLYARFIQHDERPFFGLNFDAQPNTRGCDVWDKYKRDLVTFYLAEAQREVEQYIQSFAFPRWVSEDNADDLLRDNQPFQSQNIKARYFNVLEGGIKAETDLALASLISFVTEPATIGPINLAAAYSSNEIHIFFAGTDIEIPASSILVTPGAPPTVTVTVPRARLVKDDAQDNPKEGWDWQIIPPAVDSPFEPTIDVKRIYNDPSSQATLVRSCSCNSGTCACSETTDTGCIQVLDGRFGDLRISPATYSGGSWNKASASLCGNYDIVRLNYRAGFRDVDKRLIDIIIRLAHAKMPWSPCDCDYLNILWTRDRAEPKIISPQREGCPFGTNDGAWAAWLYADSLMVKRGSSMGASLV